MTTLTVPIRKVSLLQVLLRSLKKSDDNPLASFVALGRDYHGIVYLNSGPAKSYVVWDPDLVHEMLVENGANFGKGQIVRFAFGKILGNGLFNSDGEYWKRQRHLAQPAFHTKRIASYGETMVSYTTQMLNKLAPQSVIPIRDEMMKLTLNVVAKTLFDVEIRGNEDRVGKAMHVLVETVTRAQQSFWLPSWLPTPNIWRQGRAVREMDAIIAEIITERRRTNTDQGDLLSMLLLARDDDGLGMSDQQLRDEVMTLFIAGHETTAVALTWAFYLLSQHPTVEAKLYCELDETLQGRLPTVADLPYLTYTAQIIKETIRLCPPIPLIPRETLNDMMIRGYPIKKGTPVIFAAYLAHRNPTYFDAPETFQPERWAIDFEKQLPRYAYFPFGGGPRICIGNSFAQMETQLILATVAQRYKVRLQPKQNVQPSSFISLRPATGVWMSLERR